MRDWSALLGTRLQSKSVRVDAETHSQITALAEAMGTSVGQTVSLAVRRLRQERIGQELRAELRDDERSWLHAHLG